VIFLGILVFRYNYRSIVSPGPAKTKINSEKTRIRLEDTQSSVPQKPVIKEVKTTPKPNPIKKTVKKQKSNLKEERRLKNKYVKMDFFGKSHLTMKLMPGLDYEAVDMDVDREEEIYAIYGKSSEGGRDCTVVSSSGAYDLKKIENWLTQKNSPLPSIGPSGVRGLKKYGNNPMDPNTGMDGLVVYEGINTQGKNIYIGFTSRIDKKKSYLIIFTAEEDYFEDNTNYFLGFINSMRAGKMP